MQLKSFHHTFFDIVHVRKNTKVIVLISEVSLFQGENNVFILVRWAWASLSKHVLLIKCFVMVHKPWITAGFVAKLCAAISPVKEATTVTHTLGLNFTVNSWAESLVLMSVIMHGSYLKWTQLLCMIWRYRLWAACPCLSWSAIALSLLLMWLYMTNFC